MKSTLILMLALVLGLGCSATPERVDDLSMTDQFVVELTDVKWSAQIVADMVMLNDRQPFIIFGGDGNITGNASCNSFFGTYEATGTSLKITIGGMTRMACADPVDKQEQLFMTTLRQVDRYEITGDVLTLWSGEGSIMTANLKR